MLKILSIGNSFSQDAHRHLHEIAKAAGQDLMLYNMEIGGCSLEQHWNNFVSDAPSYTLEINGTWQANGYPLSKGLALERWDIITLQQVSHFAGMPATYEPYLPNLVTALSAMFPDAKLCFQETWEYERGSEHGGFPEYGCDPDEMYRRVSKTCRAKAKENNLTLIPSGDAVHAAKQLPEFDIDKNGQSLYRDKFHMHYAYGRYLISCVWYKTLTGRSPIGNRCVPVPERCEGEIADPALLALLQKVASNTFAE